MINTEWQKSSINENFQLTDIYPGIVFGDRYLNFLIGYFNIQIDKDVFKKSDLNKYIAKNIAQRINNSISNDQLHVVWMCFKAQKIDYEKFNFIDSSESDEHLVNNYINVFLKKYKIYFKNGFDVQRLNRNIGVKNSLIYLFDVISYPAEQKEIFLNEIKSNMISIKEKTKFTSWYEKKSDRLEIASGYLWGRYSFSEIKNIDELKIFFYNRVENNNDADFIHLAITKYYYNKVSKKNKSTKQFNFALMPEVNKNIDKLSKKNGIRRSDLINIIFSDKQILKLIANELKKQKNSSSLIFNAKAVYGDE